MLRFLSCTLAVTGLLALPSHIALADGFSEPDGVVSRIEWRELSSYCNARPQHSNRYAEFTASCISIIQTFLDRDSEPFAPGTQVVRYCIPAGTRYSDIARNYVARAQDIVRVERSRRLGDREAAVTVLRSVLEAAYPCWNPADPSQQRQPQ